MRALFCLLMFESLFISLCFVVVSVHDFHVVINYFYDHMKHFIFFFISVRKATDLKVHQNSNDLVSCAYRTRNVI